MARIQHLDPRVLKELDALTRHKNGRGLNVKPKKPSPNGSASDRPKTESLRGSYKSKLKILGDIVNFDTSADWDASR